MDSVGERKTTIKQLKKKWIGKLENIKTYIYHKTEKDIYYITFIYAKEREMNLTSYLRWIFGVAKLAIFIGG